MSQCWWRRRRARWLIRVLIAIGAFVLFAFVDDWLSVLPPPDIAMPWQRNARADVAYFYFQAVPTWSTVTVDGRVLERIPQQGQAALELSTGRHGLTWRAEPFMPVQCTLVVPPVRGGGSCQTQALTPDEQTFLIVLPISLRQLPDEQRAALIQTVQAALDTKQVTETVRHGERYAFAQDPARVLTAEEELSATRRLLLHTDSTQSARCNGLSLERGCTIAGQDCRFFCTMSAWPVVQPARPQWNIAALFSEDWQYTTADGRHLLPVGDGQRAPDQFVTLRISRAEGRWEVTFHTSGDSSFDDPLCVGIAGVVLKQSAYQQLPERHETISWAFVSDPPRTASCLAAGYVREDTASSQPDKPSVALLMRFGVVQAANDEARRRWPTLPVADAPAQQLAQRMMEKARL